MPHVEVEGIWCQSPEATPGSLPEVTVGDASGFYKLEPISEEDMARLAPLGDRFNSLVNSDLKDSKEQQAAYLNDIHPKVSIKHKKTGSFSDLKLSLTIGIPSEKVKVKVEAVQGSIA